MTCKRCTQCGATIHFDGQNVCLLNMGKFCIAYEVMRELMFQFLLGRYDT